MPGSFDGAGFMGGNVRRFRRNHTLMRAQDVSDNGGVGLRTANEEMHVGVFIADSSTDFGAGGGAVGVKAVAGGLFEIAGDETFEDGRVTAGEVVATKGGHKMLRKNADYTRAVESRPAGRNTKPPRIKKPDPQVRLDKEVKSAFGCVFFLFGIVFIVAVSLIGRTEGFQSRFAEGFLLIGRHSGDLILDDFHRLFAVVTVFFQVFFRFLVIVVTRTGKGNSRECGGDQGSKNYFFHKDSLWLRVKGMPEGGMMIARCRHTAYSLSACNHRFIFSPLP